MNALRITVAMTSLAVVFALFGCANRQPTAGEKMLSSADNATAQPAPVASDKPVDTPAARPATQPSRLVEKPAPTQPAGIVMPEATRPLANTAPAPTAVVIAQLPPDADTATKMRAWSISTCYYQNGSTVAGPVYRILPPPAQGTGAGETVIVETLTTAYSIPQILFTPIWAFITPPLTPVTYTGVQFAPSYTVDDPQPERLESKPGLLQLKRTGQQ